MNKFFGRRGNKVDDDQQRRRTKKQRALPSGHMVGRQINLMQKLMGRHRRLECSDDKSHVSQASLKSSKEANPFKRIIKRGLRPSKRESFPVETSLTERDDSPTPNYIKTPPRTPPRRPKPLHIVGDMPTPSPTKINFTPMRSMRTPSKYQYLGQELVGSVFECRPLEEIAYHQVIESAISKNLYNDHQQLPSERAAPNVTSSPVVVGFSVLATSSCVISLIMAQFSALLCLASILTIALTATIAHSDRATSTLESVLNRISLLEAERESWETAKMHLWSRSLAAKSAKRRLAQIQAKLGACIQQSKRCRHLRVSQVVEMDLELARNLQMIEDGIRNQVLVTVTKALLISNPTTDRVVLNQLGVEILIRRLQTIPGLTCDPKELQGMIKTHGQTKFATKMIYQKIMSQQSTLFVYEPLKAIKR